MANPQALFFETLWNNLHRKVEILVLRNFENFPNDFGNDIDCLVHENSMSKVIEICKSTSTKTNFKITKITNSNHGLCSIFFKDLTNPSSLIKIDFFSQLSKGWFSYAKTEEVLLNKVKYKDIYVPKLSHEAYLLLMKELFMYGRIRSQYHEKFKYKYNKIDIKEFYKISKNLVSEKTITKIEKNYKNIIKISLVPMPTLKNILKPSQAIKWAYYRCKYKLNI